MDVLLTVFWGLVVLVFLVVIHEAGHFVAARSFGVRVTEFMIGLPGPSIGFERNGCRYGITAIPLGGYNRITGMEGGPQDPNLEAVIAYVYRHGTADAEHVAAACSISIEEAENALFVLDEWGSINKPKRSNPLPDYAAPKTEEYALGEARVVDDPKALLDSERSHTYRGLPSWKRIVVLLAGPAVNIVFAFLVLLVLFCGVGISTPTNTLSQVSENSPAAQAGLQAGDTLTALGDTQVSSWTELDTAISTLSVGQSVKVSYLRAQEPADTTLKVGKSEEGKPYFGISPTTEQVRMSPIEGLSASWEYFAQTVSAYAKLFNPVTTAETVSQSSSVVGIAVVAKKAADTSSFSLIYLLAIISLSLGVVNLVPLPPLDGGRILIEIIQKIIRRELPVSVVNTITLIAIALFILLFIVLLRQDIMNFVLGA